MSHFIGDDGTRNMQSFGEGGVRKEPAEEFQ